MRTYSSNQEFYDHIDTVVVSLRSEGFNESADQIHFLIHKVAWTTSSELFGELKDRFEKIIHSQNLLPESIKTTLKEMIITIDNAWARANGAV